MREDDPETAAVIAAIRADRIAELEAELKALRPTAPDDVPSLVKDFHILYRLTERLASDMGAEQEIDLGFVKAQLARLLPAFEECEAARRLAAQGKERN